MGKKAPFTKGDWKYQNKHERFKHARFKKDRNALKQIRKKGEPDSLEPLCETDNADFEAQLIAPKSLLRKMSSESGAAAVSNACKDTSPLRSRSGSVSTASADAPPSDNGLHARQPAGKQRKVNTGLLSRFKKELHIAEVAKQQREAEKANHEQEIKARQEALRVKKKERDDGKRAWKQRTKRGQLKMEGVISTLTQRIMKHKSNE